MSDFVCPVCGKPNLITGKWFSNQTLEHLFATKTTAEIEGFVLENHMGASYCTKCRNLTVEYTRTPEKISLIKAAIMLGNWLDSEEENDS
jgi:hypothetical protein